MHSAVAILGNVVSFFATGNYSSFVLSSHLRTLTQWSLAWAKEPPNFQGTKVSSPCVRPADTCSRTHLYSELAHELTSKR
ncbi:hypothetical protein BS17DRAFT_325191 [Gyrodon lividus]|nr:hypothetical protein BS17DRAFT_325191 [Gyrodon lividus]